MPDDELEQLVFVDDAIVFRAGSAEILGAFRISETRLTIELAQIDDGGEGVLPTLWILARRYAKKRGVRELEWIVHAIHCARPNLKLRRVLDKKGFIIENVPGVGEAYHLLQDLTDSPRGFSTMDLDTWVGNVLAGNRLTDEADYFVVAGQRDVLHIDRHVTDEPPELTDCDGVLAACLAAVRLMLEWSDERQRLLERGLLVSVPQAIIDGEWLRSEEDAPPPHVQVGVAATPEAFQPTPSADAPAGACTGWDELDRALQALDVDIREIGPNTGSGRALAITRRGIQGIPCLPSRMDRAFLDAFVAALDGGDDEDRQFLMCLEFVIGLELNDLDPAWSGRPLDGILPDRMDKTDRRIEVTGICYLIEDQSVSPIWAEVERSDTGVTFSFLFGERGTDRLGIVRTPGGGRRQVRQRVYADPNSIDWAFEGKREIRL